MTRLIALVRILLGLAYLINGTNWFFKLITPYPSISDFADYMPPPDIVGAMIEHGILFHLAKGMEVVGGLLLITNRLVPLALVLSMPVTVTVFIVDCFKPEFRLRAFLMGSGSMLMNTTLLLAYYHHYRPMLAWTAQADADPSIDHPAPGGAIADMLGGIGRIVLAPLLALSALLGTAMLVWLLVMMAQYAADPRAIHEVKPLTPRAAAPQPSPSPLSVPMRSQS